MCLGTLSILIIRSGGRVLDTINVDQRAGRLVPPADKRLLKQTVNPPCPLFPILNSSFSPPSGAISGAAIGELGTKGKDAPIALKWSLHPILHCQLHCTEQICIVYCSKLHCSSAVQLQCRLSAQIDSLASPKSYRSCKMNTATALAGLEAMRDPVQHSRRKQIALQCNLTIIKVIVLQMEKSACIAVTPIYSCTFSFLRVCCAFALSIHMFHTSCLG